jgi:hypothetical protein
LLLTWRRIFHKTFARLAPMERRSFATLILTTVCFAACDPKSEPTDKPQEQPAPASQAPSPSAEPEPQPSPAPAAKQPAPSPGPAKQPPPAAQPTKPQPSRGGRGEEGVRSFAVYTLSRGSGVPAAAREAQQKVQELVEFDRGRGVVVTVQGTRIGIEGERRLCLTYADPQEAARALERVRAMVKGVDLVNVVVEPCAPPAVESPTKEKP